MFPVSLPPVDEARVALQKNGFFAIPSLIGASSAGVLRLSASTLPERRVTCGIPNVAWGEQLVPSTHLLARFFQQPAVVRFVADATSIGAFDSVAQYWTSRYRLNEYINEHRDVRGSAQLLVCLVAPPPACGGVLRFGSNGADGSLRLEVGDAVLFYATKKLHSTTPLVASHEVALPERMVAVARLFETSPET